MKNILSFATTSILAAGLSLSAFAQAPATAPTTAPAPAKTAASKAAVTPAPTAQEITDAKSKGMVWVNTNTKVYHGDGAMYGTTKHGKFMTKDEADKAGFHAAKAPVAKKSPAKKADK